MAKFCRGVVFHKVLPLECDQVDSPAIVQGKEDKDYIAESASISLRYFHLPERADTSYFYYTSFKEAYDLLSPLIVGRGGLRKKIVSINLFVLLLYNCISVMLTKLTYLQIKRPELFSLLNRKFSMIT